MLIYIHNFIMDIYIYHSILDIMDAVICIMDKYLQCFSSIADYMDLFQCEILNNDMI